MSANVDLNHRPDYDQVLRDIADYVLEFPIASAEALDTARNCLMDTLGCGLLALCFPECTSTSGRSWKVRRCPTGRGCRVRRSASIR